MTPSRNFIVISSYYRHGCLPLKFQAYSVDLWYPSSLGFQSLAPWVTAFMSAFSPLLRAFCCRHFCPSPLGLQSLAPWVPAFLGSSLGPQGYWFLLSNLIGSKSSHTKPKGLVSVATPSPPMPSNLTPSLSNIRSSER